MVNMATESTELVVIVAVVAVVCSCHLRCSRVPGREEKAVTDCCRGLLEKKNSDYGNWKGQKSRGFPS